MVRQRRANTVPEVALRKELHRRGFRYRVDFQLPLRGVRRRADIVFTARRVAVFVDGCYWHACPVHATWPTASSEWWRAKLEANVRRDRDTDQRLAEAGWLSLRFWEHDDPIAAADQVESELRTP
jgi:DNA mismatch endonuclease (patch repair protein)